MKNSVREWASEMRENVAEQGLFGLAYVPFTLYLSLWYALSSRVELGHNVYEDEWDVLVVLDACRVDTLREVADEYDFIEEVDARWSVGSQSAEWIANTFTNRYRSEIRETAYLSGNPYTDSVIAKRMLPPRNNTVPVDASSWDVVRQSDFFDVELLWSSQDETYNVVLPRTITDRAILTHRERNPGRMILHYMQPHIPHLGPAVAEGREMTETEREGYQALERGEASREEVYDNYRETLRYVLDDVEVLLENVDADRVIITADHGESFGEGGVYGHPEGMPYPVIKRVPWVETSATDEGTRQPETAAEATATDDEIEDHLKDLGYM